MKVVLAFDSFKGCMTAQEACHTAALTIHETLPQAEVVECPLSDGGEGLVDCVEKMLCVKRVSLKAHDPLMNIIDASYVISEDGTAYMEMAATSGLTLVPYDKRNPMLTTTYGVGDMIIDAARCGCKEIVMGIGGSATCDGGRGMIQCLKDNGYTLPFANTQLPHIMVASDVTNPLYGELGAAYVFAPQKGATPEQVKILDERLREFAKETEALALATPELAVHPGAGAAGGLGYGLMAYLKAELKSGIEIILSISKFDDTIKDASLIITGEGKSDAQTLMGKVPHGVLNHGKKHDIPVWLLSGGIENEDLLAQHFDVVRSINEGDKRPLATLLQPDVAMGNLRETVKVIIVSLKATCCLFL
jgi:glycerate kinase